MKALFVFTLCLLLGISVALTEEPQEIKPVSHWQGSSEANEPGPEESKVITTAAEFAALWKKCGRSEEPPAIDWNKNFALFASTAGSRINLRPTLEADGNVKAMAIATRDLRPGFRYLLFVLPREGVKTVNGVKLP